MADLAFVEGSCFFVRPYRARFSVPGRTSEIRRVQGQSRLAVALASSHITVHVTVSRPHLERPEHGGGLRARGSANSELLLRTRCYRSCANVAAQAALIGNALWSCYPLSDFTSGAALVCADNKLRSMIFVSQRRYQN